MYTEASQSIIVAKDKTAFEPILTKKQCANVDYAPWFHIQPSKSAAANPGNFHDLPMN